MSNITDFYQGTGTDHDGRTLADMLKFDLASLEQGHDYIQWMFPLPEASRFFFWAPLLSDEDIATFKADTNMRHRVKGSLVVMTRFYEASPQWCTPRNHNLLRITRILRFLTLIGLSTEAQEFHDTMVRLTEPHPGVATEETLWFWSQALTLDPEFVA